MEKNVLKVHAPIDYIVAAILLLVGIGLFFVNRILGVTIVVVAILCFLLFKSGYRMEGDGKLLKKKNVELSRHCRETMLDFINGSKKEPEMIKGNLGGTILLEVWYNAKETVAYVRLSDYVEFAFQKLTEIVEMPTEKAAKLISEL